MAEKQPDSTRHTDDPDLASALRKAATRFANLESALVKAATRFADLASALRKGATRLAKDDA